MGMDNEHQSNSGFKMKVQRFGSFFKWHDYAEYRCIYCLGDYYSIIYSDGLDSEHSSRSYHPEQGK